MNRSIEVLKQIYKPYRYTIKGKALILNTSSGDFVVKEKKEKSIKDLYAYLNSRNFHNFPNLIDESRSDVNVYEYVESVSMPDEQKALDLVDVLSNLHNKTTFYKTVTSDDFKEIYDKIKGNILYLKNYYNTLYDTIKKEEYMSPSHYSFIRNSYKLFAALDFSNSELDAWYDLVREETKKRVSLIHNKVSLDHFVKSSEDYLISWEDYRIDTPVVDLVTFYRNNYFDIHFDVVLKRYFEKTGLSADEKKLFFLIISIPKKIEFSNTEFHSVKNVREALDYLFITEELVRPYYAVEQKN